MAAVMFLGLSSATEVALYCTVRRKTPPDVSRCNLRSNFELVCNFNEGGDDETLEVLGPAQVLIASPLKNQMNDYFRGSLETALTNYMVLTMVAANNRCLCAF